MRITESHLRTIIRKELASVISLYEGEQKQIPGKKGHFEEFRGADARVPDVPIDQYFFNVYQYLNSDTFEKIPEGNRKAPISMFSFKDEQERNQFVEPRPELAKFHRGPITSNRQAKTALFRGTGYNKEGRNVAHTIYLDKAGNLTTESSPNTAFKINFYLSNNNVFYEKEEIKRGAV